MTNAANSVVGSERLITKIYFPRLAVPFASVAASAVDFLVACGLLALVCLAYGVEPTWQALLAPVVFAKELTRPSFILAALGAFAVFCLLAGAVYTLNDIVDAPADRVHPVKRRRPIASGRVPVPVAKATQARGGRPVEAPGVPLPPEPTPRFAR